MYLFLSPQRMQANHSSTFQTSDIHCKHRKGPYLKIIHAVGERDHKARVVVDGLVTENDIHAVVEIPEIVLSCRQLAAVVFWVVPA